MLMLKEWFIALLLGNVDPKIGHLNGTQYIVENMTNIVLFSQIATRMQKGANLTLLKIRSGSSDDCSLYRGSRSCSFPFACSCNNNEQTTGAIIRRKSDNQSLRWLLFSWSAYLALWRATHFLNIVVLSRYVDRILQNIAYPEALLNT